ncbi:MAG TPA: hypothetical protein PKC39_08890 [Ferruginibacter sp.]|nr:hypothetical protein [Ferruginibacter sp.]HMP21061.1 hypothetical protein [Ferruginibacter sp.]
MKYIFCFFMLGAGFVFYGCTTCSVKQVPCEAFDEPAFSTWFPYTDKSMLLFKNTSTADTFSYIISGVGVSDAYTASRGGYNNRTQGCTSSAYIYALSNPATNTSFSVDYDVLKIFDNGPVTKSLFISLLNSYWYAGAITETTIEPVANNWTDSITITKVQQLEFDNGHIYPAVVILSKDTLVNKNSKVHKLFIAKNSGIIGFEMYPSKERWVIQ